MLAGAHAVHTGVRVLRAGMRAVCAGTPAVASTCMCARERLVHTRVRVRCVQVVRAGGIVSCKVHAVLRTRPCAQARLRCAQARMCCTQVDVPVCRLSHAKARAVRFTPL